MPQELSLQMVTRDDVVRIKRWLEDEEVSESWFGRYAYGDPAHLGYHPNEMDEVSDEKWDAVFDNPEHRMLSIYSPEAGHIGEVHLAIEESLGDGQLSILIGRKDLWHHGYGSAAARHALETAFTEYGLYRVWVDIPEYNTAARSMFSHLGFSHEGTLRQSRPHEGSRFDSVIMGLLANEYVPLDEAAIQEIPRV